MKSLIAGLILATFAFGAEAASTYYVDVRGDDSWTGTADWDHRDTSVTPAIGPIRTLANLTNLVTATSKSSTVGDTVYLAEGDYDYGSNVAGTYRAVLPNGTRLIGVGDRNKIRIFGSATDETATVGENPMRCLQLGSWVLVKGVTLCNGRATGNGGAAIVATDATGPYVVACVISNNYAQGRGGALGSLTSGAAIRCLFTKNNADGTGKCVYATTCWNCVFDQVGMDDGGQHAVNYLLYNATSYNCTFVGGGGTPRNNSHYNMLSLVRDNGASATTVYRSLFALSEIRSTNGGGSKWNVGADQLQLEGSYIPVQGVNLGYDYGSNKVYTANFPTSALVSDQKNLDFNGNTRIQGAAIDCGACEADPSVRHLVLADAQTGLTVEGAAIGTTTIAAGESVTLRISRNYSTGKLCTGLSVNGEFFSFTGEDSDRVYERTYSAEDPVPYLKIEAVYAEHNDWYVDVNGGDDGNNGYTKYQAKRTLAGAMTNALLAAGDVVHAAAGVYNEGTMAASATSTLTNRVIVKAGVELRADEGADVTAIEGFIPEKAKWGTTDPIRCATLGDGATIRGFTLRNGMASLQQKTGTLYSNTGGGLYGGTAIDCVVSNCYAVRGGGVSDTTLIRCRVMDNYVIPTGTLNPAGGSASATAPGMMTGSAYDSYLENQVLNLTRAVNSWFAGSLGRNGSGSTLVYNCYVEADSRYLVLTNSIVGGSLSAYSTLGAGSYANIKLKSDKNGRPDATDANTAAYAIDKGNRAYYVYPSVRASEAGTDLAGGQRVYNGQIDIGCGEYDWRGDFTQQLAVKGVEVTAAGANVTTNDLAGLVLSDGDTLRLKLVAKAAGQVSFRATVAGEGAVTAELDGTPIVGEEGVYAFDCLAGELELTISFAGTGTATLSDVSIPKAGVIFLIQ